MILIRVLHGAFNQKFSLAQFRDSPIFLPKKVAQTYEITSLIHNQSTTKFIQKILSKNPVIHKMTQFKDTTTNSTAKKVLKPNNKKQRAKTRKKTQEQEHEHLIII